VTKAVVWIDSDTHVVVPRTLSPEMRREGKGAMPVEIEYRVENGIL
jgi:hypothetical protein